jgi:hypothetical protein
VGLFLAAPLKSAMARSAASNTIKNLHKICHVNLNLSIPEWPKPFNCEQVPGMLFKGIGKKSQPQNDPNKRGIPCQKVAEISKISFPDRTERKRAARRLATLARVIYGMPSDG